jgi:ABC-2 type transport system permease protein
MGRAFGNALRRETRFLATHFWDLALVSWVPLLLMAIVGIQLSAGVMRDLPIAVVDEDHSAVSRELTRLLDAAPGLSVAARPADMATAERLVRSNRAYAIVLIPTDSERAVLRGTTASIPTFYNASYSTAAGSALREVGNVVQGYATTLATTQTAITLGPTKVRRPPIAAQSLVLFNPQGSYELQLVALLHPALLHLIFMVAVASALGRELRDGTIGAWIGGERPAGAIAAVAGKLTPYLAIFTGWGLLAIGYVAGLRGWPVAGSVTMLLAGYLAMYLAYVGVTLLILGLTLNMGRALSAAGLYAGASFAFAGAIFPVESASAFARLWSALLPYSAFAKLLSEQWIMGASVAQSMTQILVMLAFLLVGGGIGLPRYLWAARHPETWRQR